MNNSKSFAFACQQCRSSKRRCDGTQPYCSTCLKNGKACVYNLEPRARKRKYWDEHYVRSLENQVHALLSLQQKQPNSPSLPQLGVKISEDWPSSCTNPSLDLGAIEDAPLTLGQQCTSEDRSQMAMEELGVMMWRTNLGDGVTVVDDVGQPPASSQNKSQFPIPPCILAYCQDESRIHSLAGLFIDNINEDHQFTQYQSSEFLSNFPCQAQDYVFLHSAILAAGAAFEGKPDSTDIGDVFAELSESIVFSCFRHTPTLRIIQGLCILSWRSLALGRDQFGWTFISMAAGMAVHLRLHVLALDEFASRACSPSISEVQTFWSFYMTDRTAVSILGRNCVLPWRRVNVPAFDTVFSSDQADISQISFAWQCKLWYMHDQNMDQMYAIGLPTIPQVNKPGNSADHLSPRFSSAFDRLGIPDQVRLLVSTHDDLNRFLRSYDSRLKITRDPTPKPVLLFHMAYQMAILVTMPPFLRLFATEKGIQTDASNAMPLVLRSITSAAGSMVRLVRAYRQTYGFQKANPLLIHHLLSATIVHLMNTTSKSQSFRRSSTRLVRTCLGLLDELSHLWRVRSQKSINVIKALAHRWGVGFSLTSEPVQSSGIAESDPSSKTLDKVDGSLGDLESCEQIGFSGDFLPYGIDQHPTIEESSLYQDSNIGLELEFPTAYNSLLGGDRLDLFQLFQDFGADEDIGWALPE